MTHLVTVATKWLCFPGALAEIATANLDCSVKALFCTNKVLVLKSAANQIKFLGICCFLLHGKNIY